MSDVMTKPESIQKNVPPSGNRPVEVFAVYGVEPEVQAYAMAKYSRSALSMKESLKEISSQKAEKFLNTFYFQYGHRSIADLAHIAFAIERLSILAAIILVDEQRWDGQERSTRYQDFRKSGYFVPEFADERGRGIYTEAAQFLFSEYDGISEQVFRYLAEGTPKPDEMKTEQYERTLRARTFDVSRYLLPLATNTSLGQIVNARTLETQISRLLSSPFAEVRQLGHKLKEAAKSPAYDVNREAVREFADELRERDEGLARRLEAELGKEIGVSPTMVKYADPNQEEISTRRDLAEAARDLMTGEAVEAIAQVDLLDENEPLEIELATTLLYEQCLYPYRQLRRKVESLEEPRRREIIDLGFRHRGRHDEVLRAFAAGQRLR